MDPPGVKKGLYAQVEPYDSGFLKVSGVHTIYYEQSGNPNSHNRVCACAASLGWASHPVNFAPVVFLHGVLAPSRRPATGGSSTRSSTGSIYLTRFNYEVSSRLKCMLHCFLQFHSESIWKYVAGPLVTSRCLVRNTWISAT